VNKLEIPENISEYWFLEHYRVIKIEEDDETILSVDVYRRKWPFEKVDESKCVDDNYCLLYKFLDTKQSGNLNGIEVDKIVVTGIKAGDIYETINVRWIIRGKIKFSDIEKIFYESWRIIGCSGPVDDPWITNCPEEKQV